jgi:hypothetical protein
LDHVEEPLSRQRSSPNLITWECNEFVYWKTWTDYEPDVFNYRAWVNLDMPLAEIVFDFTIVWKRFLKVMHRLIIRQ